MFNYIKNNINSKNVTEFNYYLILDSAISAIYNWTFIYSCIFKSKFKNIFSNKRVIKDRISIIVIYNLYIK